MRVVYQAHDSRLDRRFEAVDRRYHPIGLMQGPERHRAGDGSIVVVREESS
jgi:hypothetical protein